MTKLFDLLLKRSLTIAIVITIGVLAYFFWPSKENFTSSNEEVSNVKDDNVKDDNVKDDNVETKEAVGKLSDAVDKMGQDTLRASNVNVTDVHASNSFCLGETCISEADLKRVLNGSSAAAAE